MTIECPKCQFDNPNDTAFCGKCGTNFDIDKGQTKTLETPTEELTRGTVFAGRYEIIEELGKGGMGRVFRVEDTKVKEEVALKLIKPEIASDKKTIERFSNELKLARKIAHRNVCKMYDLNEEDGTTYITMEYVPGEDLKSFIRRSKRLDIGTAISISKQICEGLAEAHRLGIIHRDLKPSNVMIDKEGNARIMDFGIARSLQAKGITGKGIIIGTPEYMSPEQAEAKEVDQSSDLYSLGIILYEMVTSQLPFEGDTPLSIAMKHKSETPPDARKLNRQIPEALSQLILKCMEKAKENRYQSAITVFDDLDNIGRAIPTTQREVPKKKPITSKEITITLRAKKILIPAFVLLALIVVGLMIWRPWSSGKSKLILSDKPSIAILYFENTSKDPNLDSWRMALPQLLITDLTQSRYLKVLSDAKIYSILNKMNLLKTPKYSMEDLVKVTEEGNVRYVLTGSFIRTAEAIIITAIIHKPMTEEVLKPIKIECKDESEFLSKVDELTVSIKSALNLSREQISGDIDVAMGKITTSFPQAFKYYSDGRRYQHKGDLDLGVEFMKRAIDIDPEFAMAYRALWACYSTMGYTNNANQALKKAFELSERLPENESYAIQGRFYRLSEKTFDKAFQVYNKLLSIYPDHANGNINLGQMYSHIEQWDKAIERYNMPIEDKYELHYPYHGIALVYEAKGMYKKAAEVLEIYLKNISEHPIIRKDLANNYVNQGKYDLALIDLEKLSPEIDSGLKGRIHHLKGELLEAENNYQEALQMGFPISRIEAYSLLGALYLQRGKFKDSRDILERGIELAERIGAKDSRSYLHSHLAYTYLKSGNFNLALDQCNKALLTAEEAGSYSLQILPLHLKGHIYLKMNSLDKAVRTADELKSIIDMWINKKLMRFYLHLTGSINIQRRDISKAITDLERAIDLLPSQSHPDNVHALFLDALASAYYESGQTQNAVKTYERIQTLTTGRLLLCDLYAESFYMLGKLYDKQGEKAKAIEHYQKFLSLWKDADPDLPEVNDAKKRLTGLKRE